jgi:hypothetical protein
MPTPLYDRPELRPEGDKGVSGGAVPHAKKPQPQETPAYKPGSGGGNDGSKNK